MEKNNNKPHKTVVFFGIGSIAHRHISILQAHHNCSIYSFQSHAWDIKCITNILTWDEFDELRPDIAFITNITNKHVITARLLAHRNIPLFIEKPLSNSIDGLTELAFAVRLSGLQTYVAYPFRFHDDIARLKQTIVHFPDSKVTRAKFVCKTDSTKWPSRRKLDHVLLELSHEFDTATWLFGPVSCICPSNSFKISYTKCTFSIVYESGTIVDFELDMRADEETRFIHIGTEFINLTTTDDMYVKQMGYFMDCVDDDGSDSDKLMINNVMVASLMVAVILGIIKYGESRGGR